MIFFLGIIISAVYKLRFSYTLVVVLLISSPSWSSSLLSLWKKSAQSLVLEETNHSLFRQVHSSSKHGRHIKPNEVYPEEMLPLTNLALKGLYLGVGTERAFIATAINPQMSAAVFFDIDPAIVLYNRLNIELLSIAVDPADYAWLRTKASWTDIEQRWIQNGMQNPVLQAHFEWFIQVLRHENQGDLLNSNFLTISESANYLKNPELCLRLMQMAKEHRIFTLRLDLKSKESAGILQNFLKHIGLSKEPISIVDVSNAWWESHAGLPPILSFFQNLKHQVPPQGILLMTTYRKPHSFHWGYFGISPSSLQDKKSEQWISNQLAPISLTPKVSYFPSRHFGKILQRQQDPAALLCDQIFKS